MRCFLLGLFFSPVVFLDFILNRLKVLLLVYRLSVLIIPINLRLDSLDLRITNTETHQLIKSVIILLAVHKTLEFFNQLFLVKFLRILILIATGLELIVENDLGFCEDEAVEGLVIHVVAPVKVQLREGEGIAVAVNQPQNIFRKGAAVFQRKDLQLGRNS